MECGSFDRLLLYGGAAIAERTAIIVAGDAPYMRSRRKYYFQTAGELGSMAKTLTHVGYTFTIEQEILDEIPSHARYYSSVHKDGKKRSFDLARKGVFIERIIVLRKTEAKAEFKEQGPEIKSPENAAKNHRLLDYVVAP